METRDSKLIPVGGYFRESSADSSRAPPIEKQIERYHQWCAEHGYHSVAEYIDDGYSGGDWNRPDWQRSVRDAKRHFYRILWVWNQDRIARDTEQFLWFNRNMKESHVKMWEDTSNSFIDTETLGNKIKHTTLAQAGEIFRLVTSDKVKQAYRRKMQKGERWGRRQVPFDLTKLKQLAQNGLGYRQIAKELGTYTITINGKEQQRPYSYQTVRRALLNRVIVEQGENLQNQTENISQNDRGIL